MTLNDVGKHVKPKLTNGTYDFLKFVAQVLLPGLGTLYYTVAQIWGLPYAEEVVGTITAVDLFLGLALKYESHKYEQSDEKYDGTIEIDEVNEQMRVEFEDPDKLLGVRTAREVTFRVKQTG